MSEALADDVKPKELDMSNTEARIETANKSPSGRAVGRSSDLAALHLSKAEAQEEHT